MLRDMAQYALIWYYYARYWDSYMLWHGRGDYGKRRHDAWRCNTPPVVAVSLMPLWRAGTRPRLLIYGNANITN